MNISPALTLLYQQDISQLNTAIINAHAHPLLGALQRQAATLTLSQHFKPEINALQATIPVASVLEGMFECILLLPSKDKVQTLGWIAQAFEHLQENGKLIIVCENKYGAKSYEAALKKIAGQTQATSKAKCRLFSARKSEALDTTLQQAWLEESQPKQLKTHGLWAQAGIFSWKNTDIGSALLLQHLPNVLTGSGMDLCCGYGVLSAHILAKQHALKALHLVEADAQALACAKRNTSAAEQVSYHHVDAVSEPLPKHLDWVVCNPPFHRGHERDVELGQNIITRACHALKRGGELYLVANRQLPYEKLLQTHLSRVEVRAVGQGFKIIYGQR